jgi:simple sugar transport system ATP-binding protein
MAAAAPLLEAVHLSKYFGRVVALHNVSMTVNRGEVVCLLGDNGAGKSTLVKLFSGLIQPDEGHFLVDGVERAIDSSRTAFDLGIATVHQDLAVLPLMSVARNFVLGDEPTTGIGPFRRYDHRAANDLTQHALHGMGIELTDTSQLAGTLSGGERQSLAIARAERRGARVLILDEPTSALGVKEAAIVLRHIIAARARGLGVILISHNVQHVLPVGDRFVILSRGRPGGTFRRDDVDELSLQRLMGGGPELQELHAELENLRKERVQP